jgi:sulfatase maturation enzyme AslB (radical SAM superfamily)
MPNFTILEPAAESPIFQMHWELTMKCNLDCSYCGSHDNSTKHPSLEECLKTVDFLLSYCDLYMKHKPVEHRKAILTLFGGESIYHPDFITILEEIRARHESYKNDWFLNIHCITNAVVPDNKWDLILKYVNSFTVSYHTESTEKQQEQIKRNLLALRDTDKWYQCSIMMHPDHFENNLSMIEFCKENNVNYLPRQLDQDKGNTKFSYTQTQVQWFDGLYKRKSTKDLPSIKVETTQQDTKTDLAKVGRACCGGESFNVDKDYDNKVFFITENNFRGWSCSVNWFFVFVKQLDGNIYLNKDCKMSFDGTVSPIGNISDYKKILTKLEYDLNNDMPVITCNKDKCWCGLCSPKASSRELYDDMMRKYAI